MVGDLGSSILAGMGDEGVTWSSGIGDATSEESLLAMLGVFWPVEVACELGPALSLSSTGNENPWPSVDFLLAAFSFSE